MIQEKQRAHQEEEGEVGLVPAVLNEKKKEIQPGFLNAINALSPVNRHREQGGRKRDQENRSWGKEVS